jgi:RimJ/RimL family protein N-acetyltransferase
MVQTIDTRLRQHLRSLLGRWPSTAHNGTGVDVVGSRRRERGGWDGRVFPLMGIHAPPGSTVLSVRRTKAGAVRTFVARAGVRYDDLVDMLPTLLDRPDQQVYSGVFRWCDRPAGLPDAGAWEKASDPDVPEWLRPFGHEVLIARDPGTGEYLAGVGLKHHDRYGQEIAVGTQPSARGRGLARRLVAQAARRVLDEGAVPTYQHDPANIASARVADAAGFPDRGWRSLGMW